MEQKDSPVTSWLRIILFLLMTLLPFLYWISGAGNITDVSAENRTLSEKPVFKISSLRSFPTEYETYFNDHLPLRSQMVSANSVLNIQLTKTSSNSSVIIGDEDWLFYNNVGDGDTLGQYTGRLNWGEEKLEAVAQHVVNLRNQLAEKDIDFILFFAPNKERMYYPYMPNLYGPPSETYPVKQLVDYLHEHTDVCVVYPFDELQQAISSHPEHTLYYKYDTHWNALGAYIGSCALMNEMGVDLPAYSDLDIAYENTNQSDRDLANMLNLGSWYGADRVYQLHGYSETAKEVTPWELIPSVEAFNDTIEVNNETGDFRKLVMVRDSFCTAMLPYVSSGFQSSSYIRTSAYTPEKLMAQNPDIVVLELVERNIEYLSGFEVQ